MTHTDKLNQTIQINDDVIFITRSTSPRIETGTVIGFTPKYVRIKTLSIITKEILKNPNLIVVINSIKADKPELFL